MNTTKKANNVTGTGTILTRCPDCGRLVRVIVNFPYEDKGFETTTHECEFCGCKMIVKDLHRYDENGFIIA